MSRQSATRARCSESPFFSSEIPAFFTRLTICGGWPASCFSSRTALFMLMRAAGAAGALRGGAEGAAAEAGGSAGRPPRARVVVDADAVVAREPGEAGAPALTDGTKFPRALPPVELPEDEGRLGGGVGDVEAHELGAAGSVTSRCRPVA